MTQCTNNTITWAGAQMADCSCCIAALRSASFMMLWSVNLLGWRLEPVWCHSHTGNGKSFKFICFALRQCATLPGDTVRWELMSEVSARAYGSLQTLRHTRSAIIGVWSPASAREQACSALWSGNVSVSCFKLLFFLVCPVRLQSLHINASWPQRPFLLFELYMSIEVPWGLFTCCLYWAAQLLEPCTSVFPQWRIELFEGHSIEQLLKHCFCVLFLGCHSI